MTDKTGPPGDVPEVWWQPGIHSGCIGVPQASVLDTPYLKASDTASFLTFYWIL